MTKAVLKASKWLLRDFSELENLQVSIKNNNDFLTSADLKADKILREELLYARPSYSLISEEASEVIGEDASHKWLIDPLDGTMNYMHGFPHWAISVALEKDNEAVAAITYDPVKNEMFWAEKGCGAYLNDRKIRVSGKCSLSNLLISLDASNSNILHNVSSFCPSIRKTGSTTLNMAYLAAGRIDIAYPSPKPNKWDMMAGMLLIKEAGGVLATKDGKPTNDYQKVDVMTNVDLLALLQKL
jgi:myo-inositol-1(or 4)-monophosphatase